jgi:hypothetical protein
MEKEKDNEKEKKNEREKEKGKGKGKENEENKEICRHIVTNFSGRNNRRIPSRRAR